MSELMSISPSLQLNTKMALSIENPPPTTNRGVEKEKVSQKCDWIAFTVPFYRDLKWHTAIATNWKSIPPIKNYSNGKENSQGVRWYVNEKRPQMGEHVIMPGSCLTNFQDSTDALIEWVVTSGYRMTRIDLCVDVTHSNFNPKNATYHLTKRQAKTHARKAPKWDDALDKGYTQYVGKKTSETFCRIYDKAAELGIDYGWVRVEVVYSGDRAAPAAQAYLQSKDCRSLIKAFVDFPKWRKWRKIMECETVKITVPKKESNTRVWLMSLVTRSVAKEMLIDDDDSFYIEFVQRVREEYEILLWKREQ